MTNRSSGKRVAALARVGARVALTTAALPTTYLVALLAAAAAAGGSRPAPLGRAPRLLVLLPAHDEEAGIAETVRALLAVRYPPDRREVVVVADNCSDATAIRARAAGASAWERVAPSARGKGQAVAWALQRLASDRAGVEAVAIVDADCFASPNLFEALAARLEAGADAVQARYRVSNPEESVPSALRFAGFALINEVRPRGKQTLGLSCGLYGSGMAFPLRTLSALPWDAYSITEDREYHLRLVDSGRRAVLAPEASVSSRMPTARIGEQTQQLRWDTGNARLARRWATRLVLDGLRTRSANRLHAGVELLVPPLSLVVALTVAGAALAGVARNTVLLRRAGLLAGGQALYVLAGLRLAQAPPAVYAALVRAPRLVLARVRQAGTIATGRGPRSWSRTPRIG